MAADIYHKHGQVTVVQHEVIEKIPASSSQGVYFHAVRTQSVSKMPSGSNDRCTLAAACRSRVIRSCA